MDLRAFTDSQEERAPDAPKQEVLIELEALCDRKAVDRAILVHDGNGAVRR